jgi:hypothetical protein
MQSVYELDDLGVRRDDALRIGNSWGGFELALLDADRVAFAISGAALFAECWRRATPGVTYPITVQFKPASSDTVQYWMTSAQTAAIGTAPKYFDGLKTHAYQVGYTLSGTRKVLVNGLLDTFSGVPAP